MTPTSRRLPLPAVPSFELTGTSAGAGLPVATPHASAPFGAHGGEDLFSVIGRVVLTARSETVATRGDRK